MSKTTFTGDFADGALTIVGAKSEPLNSVAKRVGAATPIVAATSLIMGMMFRNSLNKTLKPQQANEVVDAFPGGKLLIRRF